MRREPLKPASYICRELLCIASHHHERTGDCSEPRQVENQTPQRANMRRELLKPASYYQERTKKISKPKNEENHDL